MVLKMFLIVVSEHGLFGILTHVLPFGFLRDVTESLFIVVSKHRLFGVLTQMLPLWF